MVALAPPLRGNPPVTSPYGPRADGFHTGIDYGVPIGTPVYAAAAGRARRVSNVGGGWGVEIDHGDGTVTKYWHLNSRAIGIQNVYVVAGHLIGHSGASGIVTGPHLHFEVFINGRHVDPRTALQGGIGNPTTAPSVTFGEIIPEAPPGTYPDTNGSGGGRCDTAAGWRDASAVETFARPELEGYCVRITPASIIAGAATGEGDPVRLLLNVGVVAAAAMLGWSGIRKVIEG